MTNYLQELETLETHVRQNHQKEHIGVTMKNCKPMCKQVARRSPNRLERSKRGFGRNENSGKNCCCHRSVDQPKGETPEFACFKCPVVGHATVSSLGEGCRRHMREQEDRILVRSAEGPRTPVTGVKNRAELQERDEKLRTAAAAYKRTILDETVK